ncbi:MAG TPA: hypothetical protein VKI40_10480 [Terriglobales bacterium]|nr:hypothetical protein [Terriglobales bacterium]
MASVFVARVALLYSAERVLERRQSARLTPGWTAEGGCPYVIQ